MGRGEGSKGKTAGRGTKGTKARYQVPARFEGGQMPLHMRLPKLRGFKNPFRAEYQVVNLDRLAELFPDGGAVSVDDLVAKGAVRKGELVKVLGDGEVRRDAAGHARTRSRPAPRTRSPRPAARPPSSSQTAARTRAGAPSRGSRPGPPTEPGC